jgi:hypothetical protein
MRSRKRTPACNLWFPLDPQIFLIEPLAGKLHNAAPCRMRDAAMDWTGDKKSGLIDLAHAQPRRRLRMIRHPVPALLPERWQAE